MWLQKSAPVSGSIGISPSKTAEVKELVDEEVEQAMQFASSFT